ncbi:host attachment protein [Thioalkalivibrio sp. HL-Eb18]|jgi:protein required for attachment to host cells|uniref:host attachment protein n=1 Tax=Thioalkalivibrio sp. HL-Eb18 TaxID=1266913 RepID=UPI0003613F51|nr:host attachment protein [Thioalkalivibrio sp. HL-Eb18]
MDTVWIVVADAARARILSCEGRACQGLHEIETLAHSESRVHAQELVTDRPGRSWSSSGDGRHAMQETTDPSVNERNRFAREVAERLKSGYHGGSYQRLVILAAPQFLGALRELLDPQVAQIVTAQIAKNVSKIQDPAALRSHLPDFLY